jgi:hypothetical protein
MISERDLLTVWEIGLTKPLIERSLLLVSLWHPDLDISQIAAMPIGERDARLLEIREELFGSVLNNATNCPQCKQKVEWEMPIDVLWVLPSPDNLDNSLEFDGTLIKFRVPNSADIMEILALEKGISKEEALLSRCIELGSLPLPLSHEMPEALKNALLQKMEACDPQSDITMAISCPECGHNWDMTFDIMTYLWAEINDWATNLIQDVYLLAKNFCWSENDILGMGSFRRSLYVNMLVA